MPKLSMPSTCWRRVASLPASVVIGSAAQKAMTTVQSTSIPNHRGYAATDWNVSFGAVMTPMKRAGRLNGAAGAPVVAVVFGIGEVAGRTILVQYVSSAAEVSWRQAQVPAS